MISFWQQIQEPFSWKKRGLFRKIIYEKHWKSASCDQSTSWTSILNKQSSIEINKEIAGIYLIQRKSTIPNDWRSVVKLLEEVKRLELYWLNCVTPDGQSKANIK